MENLSMTQKTEAIAVIVQTTTTIKKEKKTHYT